ncbi:hypothetical protein MJ560_09390 [Klebsiella pneumoniae]|nr:hypothetical protein MJ560_09390 [Klebsiella pneumoniae]
MLGETSRADNFSLVGYSRSTNRQSRRRTGVIYFSTAYHFLRHGNHGFRAMHVLQYAARLL